jgi:hypothetical protein
VTASDTELGLVVPLLALPVTFDLVAPSRPGDLAGLQLLLEGSTLGTPADITVRPATNPAGVGLNIAFANIPNSITLGAPVSIAVDELKTTFNGLRLPTSCPSSAAKVIVSGNSYQDPTTRTASAPLDVTGCSSLAYAPAFHVTAAKGPGDSGVQIVTDVTQRPGQATSRTVGLEFPAAVLAPNVPAVLNGGILCSNPASGSCKTIGSASATSPLFPTSLTGKTYLTGSLTAPAITIVFPSPFSLTLSGTVDLATNTTTFHNVPDIPLSDLKVTLTGGADAAFATTCVTPSGTATATLTSQNGDRTVSVPSHFTVSGCTSQGAGGGGSGGGGGTKPNSPTPGAHHQSGRPQIRSASFSGLVRGKPTLSFTLVAGRNAPKLSAFTIKLPSGLSFLRRRVHRRTTVIGVSIKDAKIKSISLKAGKLLVTLRRPASTMIVKLRAVALKESRGLERKAKRHRLKSLKLTLFAKNVAGKSTTLTRQVKKLHL